MPIYWIGWQQAVRQNFNRVDNAVAQVQLSQAVFITDDWDADRNLHLSLQRAGYAVSSNTTTSCASAAELFVSGDRQVVHLRLHLPMLMRYDTVALPLFRQHAAPCLADFAGAERWYISGAS